MKYRDGSAAQIGDRVRIGSADVGVVVASIDDDEYRSDYPKEEWQHLESGLMVLTDRGALVHLDESSAQLIVKLTSVGPMP